MMIQQGLREDLSSPWPIYFAKDGLIEAGRPDAFRLLGFQKGTVQHVEVWIEDVTSADQIVGLVPVFAAKDGSGIFAVQPAVDYAEVNV
jgi:hypothetical protein